MNYQDKYTTFQDYLYIPNNCYSVGEHCGNSFFHHPGIVRYVLPIMYRTKEFVSPKYITADTYEGEEIYLELSLFHITNKHRYKGLRNQPENSYLKQKYEHPTTMTAVQNLLVNWNNYPRNKINIIGPTKKLLTILNAEGGNTSNGTTAATQYNE